MPRVKIDYVVSFSSEDPEHPANNLLNREVSKKKWLCKKGEPSCSVVLQLARAVKISSVQIGVYHAALVEVLVGRSETSNEQFQVLVPSSVFVSREESRRGAAVERVRSFGAEALAAAARAQRWDRVRVVCSQPYNKHCQYGLSFIHIDEAEGTVTPAVPPRLLELDTYPSDEDEFKPGELFAKLRQKPTSGDNLPNTSTNTGAQIRQATSQALKNIPESSTKLMKTPISKPSAKRDTTPSTDRNADRSRDTLLYTDDDERPHAKIDQVVQRHKHERDKEDKTPKHDKKDRDKAHDSSQKIKDDSRDKRHDSSRKTDDSKDKGHDSNQKTKDDSPKRTPKRNRSNSPPRRDTPQTNNNDKLASEHKDTERKRRRSNSQEKSRAPAAEPHTLLRGCVMVLSGYENPRRAAVRNIALALGAQVRRDWGPDCTHLICAFPNTPKLRLVRAQSGRGTPVARADWLEECSRLRRRLPWQWYATEPQHQLSPDPDQLKEDTPPPAELAHDDTEGDTDDEIEKVLQKQKKRRLTASTSTDTKQKHDALGTSENTRLQPNIADDTRTAPNIADDTRTGPNIADSDGEVTEEEDDTIPITKQFGGSLPNFFDGYTFAIDAEPQEEEQISRYIRAYGGLVLKTGGLEEGSSVDYLVRGRAGSAPAAAAPHAAHAVGAAWLARCHAARALLPV